MRNMQSTFKLGGYAGPVGNGRRGGSRKTKYSFTGSAPPISKIGLMLQKLALLAIPMAVLACTEPADNNPTFEIPGGNSGNDGTNEQGETLAQRKSRYAENVIVGYTYSCQQKASSRGTTTDSLKEYIEYSRKSHYNQLALMEGTNLQYTQSELTGYNNRMIQIGNDTVREFQKLNPGKNISVAPSIEILAARW